MPNGTVAPGYVWPWPPVPMLIFTYFVKSSDPAPGDTGAEARPALLVDNPNSFAKGTADNTPTKLLLVIIPSPLQEEIRTRREILYDCFASVSDLCRSGCRAFCEWFVYWQSDEYLRHRTEEKCKNQFGSSTPDNFLQASISLSWMAISRVTAFGARSRI